ncbi:class I mannose-6-phosphate isomerase [Paenibacillus sp. CC-CFT747]|nr:class I mannose-6-phosphate isomerase [Paenibacillus sp. CC-CFT747]
MQGHPIPLSLLSLLEAMPGQMLGQGHVDRYGTSAGVLVKLLDSAERLAIQVHPDRAVAQRLFGSEYGKTEAWVFLGGRRIDGEAPYVLCGFKPGMTREKWERLFADQDMESMVAALHKVYPSPGDVMLIRGGLPHAIGPGNWMVEIQEPTDITIRTERVTPSGFKLSDSSIHQGIGFERMFECFDYRTYSEEELLRKCRLRDRIAGAGAGWRERKLIGYEDTPYFGLNRLTIEASSNGPFWESDGRFSIVIVLSGQGRVMWAGGELPIEQGDYLFLPAHLGQVQFAGGQDGSLELARCFPPSVE